MKRLIKKFTKVFSRTEELKRKLKKLGIHRMELPTPFPQVNSINVYFIEGKEPTFIDSGVLSEESWEALKHKLGNYGYGVKDIRKILLTHGHVDHYGLAQKIIEHSGAQAYIHQNDLEKVSPAWDKALGKSAPVYKRYFEKIGAPEDMIAFMLQLTKSFAFVAQQIEQINPIAEEATFQAGDLTLKALHFPGHTPGMVCFYLEKERLLFSGDHILRKISPNPLLELSADGGKKFKSLVEYRKSLKKLLSLRIDFVLPGHFSFIDDVSGLFQRLTRFYQIRQKKMLDLVNARPKKPYEIMQEMFPNIIPGEIFLAISEVIANLEVLEERGLMKLVEENNAIFAKMGN
ncbi:MAG TPA: MBL fold metallo-hydrolase [bacterium]